METKLFDKIISFVPEIFIRSDEFNDLVSYYKKSTNHEEMSFIYEGEFIQGRK